MPKIYDIKVVHKNSPESEGWVRIYVGRPTPLGNPFVIGEHGTREEVIQRYRRWLWEQIRTDRSSLQWKMLADIYDRWLEHGQIELSCWCAPQACHANVVVSCLEWMAGE